MRELQRGCSLGILPLALPDSSDSCFSTCQQELTTCLSASSCNKEEVRLALPKGFLVSHRVPMSFFCFTVKTRACLRVISCQIPNQIDENHYCCVLLVAALLHQHYFNPVLPKHPTILQLLYGGRLQGAF